MDEKSSGFNNRFRYWVLTLGCLCLTSTSSNLFTFNIGQVCMASNSNLTVSLKTLHFKSCMFLKQIESFPSVDYSPAEVSILNQAMGIGTFVTTLPFIELFNRYGVKWPFFFGAVVSAFSTALIPYAAEFSIWSVGLMRFLQGEQFVKTLF